jgi:hypothetical protein
MKTLAATMLFAIQACDSNPVPAIHEAIVGTSAIKAGQLDCDPGSAQLVDRKRSSPTAASSSRPATPWPPRVHGPPCNSISPARRARNASQ